MRQPEPTTSPALERAFGALDANVRALVDGGWVAGAVVGLISDDHEASRAYGRTRDGGTTPDRDTLFEIGSVSKCFTALVLADMLTRHEVGIDATLQAILPPNVVAPSADGRPILLIDLATHLSGLPRLPASFHPADMANPYADVHEVELLAAIRTATLGAVPGTRFQYSNFGYGLLGWALARRAGISYERLVVDRITRPLGLDDTVITSSDAQRGRLAHGHDVDGEPGPAWDHDAMAGAGAIRSTMRDMLRFVRANIAREGPLANAIAESHVIRHAIDEPPGFIALGWHVHRDRNTLWHNGETGGFHAYVAFDVRQRLGVVVLANSAAPQIDSIGIDAMRALRDRPIEALILPPSIDLSDEQLERYVGTYTLAPGVQFVITHTPGTLRARLANQPTLRIHPASATEFRYRAVPATLTFELPEHGPAIALTLHQNGRDLRAPRAGASP